MVKKVTFDENNQIFQLGNSETDQKHKYINPTVQKSKLSLIIKICVVILILALIISLPIALRSNKSNKKNLSNSISISNLYNQKNQKLIEYSDYQQIQFPTNNLKIILITKDNLSQSSICLHVNNGYLDDPENKSGLSILLQKMLFLGSRHFPLNTQDKQISYDKEDIIENETYPESQTYSFTSSTSTFLKRLEQWLNIFIDPLIPQASIESEIEQILDNFQKKMDIPKNKYEFMLHELVDNNHHPYKILGIENLKDMAQSKSLTYNALWELFHSQYYAENMHIVIKTSKKIADQLQKNEIAVLFQGIPSHNVSKKKILFSDGMKKAVKKNNQNGENSLPILESVYSQVHNQNEVETLYLTYMLNQDNSDYDTTIDFISDLLKYGFKNVTLCSMIESATNGKKCSISVHKQHNRLSLFKIEVSFLNKLNSKDMIQNIMKIYLNFMDGIKNITQIEEVYDNMKAMRQNYFGLYGSYVSSDIKQVQQIAQQMSYNQVLDIKGMDFLLTKFNNFRFQTTLQILANPSKAILIHLTNNLTLAQKNTLIQSKYGSVSYVRVKNEDDSFPNFIFSNVQQVNLIAKDEKINIIELNQEKIENIQMLDKAQTKHYYCRQTTCVIQIVQGTLLLNQDFTYQLPLQEIYIQFQNRIYDQNTNYQTSYHILEESLRQQINQNINKLGNNIKIEPIQQYAGFQIIIQVPKDDSVRVLSQVLNIFDQTYKFLFNDEKFFNQMQMNTLDTLKIKKFTMTIDDYVQNILDSFLYNNIESIDRVIEEILKLSFSSFTMKMENLFNYHHIFYFAFGDVNQKNFKTIFPYFISQNSTLPYTMKETFIKYQQFQLKPKIIQLDNPNNNIESNSIGNFYFIGEAEERIGLDYIYPMQKFIQEQAIEYLENRLSLKCKIETQIINKQNIYAILILAKQCTSLTPILIDQYIDQFIQYLNKIISSTSKQSYQDMIYQYYSAINQNNFFQKSQLCFQDSLQNYFKPTNSKQTNEDIYFGYDGFKQFYNDRLKDIDKLSIQIIKKQNQQNKNQFNQSKDDKYTPNSLGEEKKNFQYQELQQNIIMNHCI